MSAPVVPPPRSGSSRAPSAAPPQGYYEMPSYPPPPPPASNPVYPPNNPGYPQTTELNWSSNPLQPSHIPQRGVPLSQQQPAIVPLDAYGGQYQQPMVNGQVPPRKRGYGERVEFAIPKRTVTVKKVELTEKGNLQSTYRTSCILISRACEA
jgi:hypothetical protein